MPTDLLSSLAAYIPRDRVQSMLHGTPLPADGVALIADVSGFTPLTEALTQGLSSDQGAEELTRALDSIFTPLIHEIHAFRGSVIKFAGDALLVWYGREPRQHRSTVVRRALTSAMRMQEAMQRHGTVPTPVGPVTLRMKIGLTYGPAKRFKLGLEELGFEDILVGATMDRMADAEHHAEPGEVLVDGATLELVPHGVQVAEWREGFAVAGRLLRPLAARPWPPLSWPEEKAEQLTRDLAIYVPAQIEAHLVAGLEHVAELRPVVSLFIQFHGLQYDTDRAVGEKLQAHFATAQRVANRHGGRLNRLITGDKGSLLHVIFGAPRVVEAQEQRAVLCALELQEECGGLPYITSQRIGIAEDRVFAGPVGAPERHDFTVMGDAINLSARLMQNAADNQILVEEAIYRRLGANFDVVDLGEIQVKGKARPISIYAAQGFSARRTVLPTEETLPLFGRDREMAQLRERIASLEGGRGNVTLLVGEAGTGKTHLLDALRAESDITWVDGICLAYGQTLSGYLAMELLRDLAELPAGAGPERSGQRLAEFCAQVFGPERQASTYPYLAHFLGLPLAGEDARRIEGLAGESLRWQIFQLMREMLAQLLDRHPVLLALDDLQWADPTSLQLIEALLPLADERPLCLVMAMHPDPDSRAWSLREQVLGGSGPAQPLELLLRRLPAGAAQELLAYLAPELPAHLAGHLIERSGGNPLYLVELVRTLEVQGLLADPVALEALDGAGLDLPDSVHGLLLAQIDRLRVEARRTLQLAAVIGRTFLHQVLDAITAGEARLEEDLATLQQRGHVREQDLTELGAAYAFRHQLVQESAYSTLLYQRRRAYHRQVAEALERLFPSLVAEQAGVLALHYEQAGDLDKAISYHGQAGDAARLLYANEEAQALYDKVLALLKMKEAEEGQASAALRDRRARTYLKLAQVRSGAGDFAGAQDYYDRAFSLWEQAGQGSDARGRDGGERLFRWGVFDHGPLSLDPALVETKDVYEVIDDLFEGLVELDTELNIIPALARRWQVSADGRRYRFDLRPGLRWSDGQPLTAHDFVFAWRRNLDPRTQAGFAHQLYSVQGAQAYHSGQNQWPETVGVEALDDLTLQVTLEAPAAYFPYLLATPITYPQPAHTILALDGDWSRPENLVNNGPYTILSWESGAEIRLARSRHFTGFSAGNLDAIELRFVYPDYRQYEDQQIDWCRIEDQPDVPERFGDHASLLQYLVTYFLGFTCASPPFGRAQVRQAFARSIDREALVRQVWNNVQRPASGGAVPPGIPGHSPEIGLPFDPEAARALLAQAGYPAGAGLPPLRLACLPGMAGTPGFLQESWRAHLGVEVEVLEDLPVDEVFDGLEQGAIQLALLPWDAEYPDPDSVLRLVFHGDSPQNVFRWRNERFDRLVDRAASLADRHERLALYHQADRILVAEETAVVPLYYGRSYGLLRPGFRIAGAGPVVQGGYFRLKHIVAEG